MARGLLRDCPIRLLSPVLCLDFSSQDRYQSVCYCASMRWFVIKILKALKFSRILFYFFCSEIWKLYQSNIETEIEAVSNESRRSITRCVTVWTRDFLIVFLNFSMPAHISEDINPKINGKRDSSVSWVRFPKKPCRKGTFKRPSLLLHLH